MITAGEYNLLSDLVSAKLSELILEKAETIARLDNEGASVLERVRMKKLQRSIDDYLVLMPKLRKMVHTSKIGD